MGGRWILESAVGAAAGLAMELAGKRCVSGRLKSSTGKLSTLPNIHSRQLAGKLSRFPSIPPAESEKL